MIRRFMYLVELDFDQETESAIDHEGIERCIGGTLEHLKARGLLSSMSEVPCPVGISSVKALVVPTLSLVIRRTDLQLLDRNSN